MCLGIPGEIMECLEEPSFLGGPMARVRFGGITKEVSLAFTPEAKRGDYVIVHVGFAISVVSESEAHRIFDILEEIGAGS